MCKEQNHKQPLPEDLVHPVTVNTTNAAPLPDYEAQGLGRYEVPPDNEIPQKERGASGQVPSVDE